MDDTQNIHIFGQYGLLDEWMDGWCTRMQYRIAMWMDDNLPQNIHNFGSGIDG
jgi:allantoicase